MILVGRQVGETLNICVSFLSVFLTVGSVAWLIQFFHLVLKYRLSKQLRWEMRCTVLNLQFWSQHPVLRCLACITTDVRMKVEDLSLALRGFRDLTQAPFLLPLFTCSPLHGHQTTYCSSDTPHSPNILILVLLPLYGRMSFSPFLLFLNDTF